MDEAKSDVKNSPNRGGCYADLLSITVNNNKIIMITVRVHWHQQTSSKFVQGKKEIYIKHKWNEYKWDYNIIVFFNLLGSPKLCPIQIWPPSTTRMADNACLGKNVPTLSESLEVRDANAKETSQPRRGSCCLQTELHKVSRHWPA